MVNINDQRLFMIDAYLMPFNRDIAKAKEQYGQEISRRIEILEKKARKNSPHLKAIQALKENKNIEYYLAFVEVSSKYKPLERLCLQKDTYLAIKKNLAR